MDSLFYGVCFKNCNIFMLFYFCMIAKMLFSSYCTLLNNSMTSNKICGVKPFHFYIVLIVLSKSIELGFFLSWLFAKWYFEWHCYVATQLICFTLSFFLIRKRDPMFAYRKMMPAYCFLNWIDYCFLLYFVSHWLMIAGMVSHLILYFGIPKIPNMVESHLEWRTSVSASIELMTMWVVWNVNKIAVFKISSEGLRSVFLTRELSLYICSLVVCIAPMAILRYRISRCITKRDDGSFGYFSNSQYQQACEGDYKYYVEGVPERLENQGCMSFTSEEKYSGYK